MRNIMIHMYDEIDLGIVWQTITKDIPPLREQLQQVISLMKE